MDKPIGQTELRILLLEDVPTDAELVEDALREAGLSFTAKRVDTRETFIRALDEFKPDVVLADYSLPAFDGGSALKIIRQQYPTIPVVMVTGAVGDEMAIELLKMGAMDYVLKDRLARLGPAVLRVLSEGQDIRARKAAEIALHESEKHFRTIFDNSPIAIWEEDFSAVKARFDQLRQTGVSDFRAYLEEHPVEAAELAALVKILGINHASVRVVGAESEEQVIRELPRYFTAESLQVFKEELIALAEGQTHFRSEIPLVNNRDEAVVFDLSLAVEPGHEDTLSRVLVSFIDITERKQAEARIQKLTRFYATLSQTNKTIVRATSREELFSNICNAAVTHGKFVLAWVGLVDETTRMVKPVCHYGAEQGYLTNIVISTDDVPAGRGPTGTAIRDNRVNYVNDYATDERTLPWREAALKRGFGGAAGLPLRFKGKAIGALTLYADEPDFFDAEQLNLLGEMANDISYALDNFAREAERKQAEEELLASEQKFLRFFMQVPIPLAVINKDGGIAYFNDRFTQVFGYTSDDLPTLKEWWQRAYPDEAYRRWVIDSWNAAVAKAAKEGTDIESAEVRVACKCGAERIVLIGGILLEDDILVTLINITERKQVESRLAEQVNELRRWHEATLGREMRTLELKHEVNELLGKSGQPPRYPSAESGMGDSEC